MAFGLKTLKGVWNFATNRWTIGVVGASFLLASGAGAAAAVTGMDATLPGATQEGIKIAATTVIETGANLLAAAKDVVLNDSVHGFSALKDGLFGVYGFTADTVQGIGAEVADVSIPTIENAFSGPL